MSLSVPAAPGIKPPRHIKASDSGFGGGPKSKVVGETSGVERLRNLPVLSLVGLDFNYTHMPFSVATYPRASLRPARSIKAHKRSSSPRRSWRIRGRPEPRNSQTSIVPLKSPRLGRYITNTHVTSSELSEASQDRMCIYHGGKGRNMPQHCGYAAFPSRQTYVDQDLPCH